MNKEKIVRELKGKCTDKNGQLFIECAEARIIAEKLAIKFIEVGKICDEEKIKIINCELGCF